MNCGNHYRLAELDSLLLCLGMGAGGLSHSLTFKKILEPDIVMYACSSGCWRLKQMGSLRPGVQSQFGQYRNFEASAQTFWGHRTSLT